MILLLSSLMAFAGQTPWALDAGEHNVFVGADISSFDKVGTADGTRTLGSPVSAVQFTGVWTFGLRDDLDLEIVLPLRSVWAPDNDAGFCVSDRPDDWCAATTGVGDLSVQARVQLLDEEKLRPLTLSMQAFVSSGALYGPSRSRLTTLGDGTTDLGLGMAVGRTGNAGNAWYRASAGAAFRYRFGLARVDDRKVPADEVSGDVSLLASPVSWVGLGLSGAALHRLGGLDLAEVDIDGPNAWVSLASTNVRTGPILAFYTPQGWTGFSTVQFSVFARNTPANLWSVTIGVGRYIDLRKNESIAQP